jgi:hypothetical protein
MYPLGSLADPATTDGRYHRRGGQGVWYASDREQAAWAELFRHFMDQGVDPFEVRRRVGAADVAGLEVLDLTDGTVSSSLGLTVDDLTGDDYAKTQQLADAARAAGFAGQRVPVVQVETPARRHEGADLRRPALDARQPTERAEAHVDDVELGMA